MGMKPRPKRPIARKRQAQTELNELLNSLPPQADPGASYDEERRGRAPLIVATEAIRQARLTRAEDADAVSLLLYATARLALLFQMSMESVMLVLMNAWQMNGGTVEPPTQKCDCPKCRAQTPVEALPN